MAESFFPMPHLIFSKINAPAVDYKGNQFEIKDLTEEIGHAGGKQISFYLINEYNT